MKTQNQASSSVIGDSANKELSQDNQVHAGDESTDVYADIDAFTIQAKKGHPSENRFTLAISNNPDYSRNFTKRMRWIGMFSIIWIIGLIASDGYIHYQLNLFHRTKWICIYSREIGTKLAEIEKFPDEELKNVSNHAFGTSSMC